VFHTNRQRRMQFGVLISCSALQQQQLDNAAVEFWLDI
jgi:hypothetical protein